MSSVTEPSLPSDADQNNLKKQKETSSFFPLPRNVYILLTFTLGKGFQLSIANLTLNLYVHSLGFKPDFIGLFSAMSAIGALIGSVPSGMLADRWGRKPVLLLTAFLSPLSLSLIALATSAPWLIILNLIQGLVSSAYWVTNLPLLSESTTERQRIGVLALNSFLILGIGSLGNLLGGSIPEFVAGLLHVSAASTVPLRWGVFSASLFTFVFGLPLWFLQKAKVAQSTETGAQLIDSEGSDVETALAVKKVKPVKTKEPIPVALFAKLLLPDLIFTMGEGAVVALIQVYFVLRFSLLPGPLGIIFTISGLVGGVFSLMAPVFVNRWGKLRIITSVQYISAPLMVLIGLAPNLPLAIAGEYTRSFLRTLIEPVYAAFEMEQVSPKLRGTLAGFYSVTWSLGFSFGPSIAGWLQTNVNLTMSFVFGGICLLIAPTLLLIFFGKKATPQTSAA
ncbi:MFS transporter [Dictyobacter alpinus]|uniref:MFS transporter n=1 Tax=Dictyobacter alpinus TaxID=2014873 RepID=A0A402B6W4_9CHLR|nr:MFS transporter [Dictyobacter alpinus]GCE27123.1 MFS transporter [Dictyobacter alpinus]